MTKEKMIQITIDNRKIAVRPGATILRSARDNGISIPSLCALEHLPSYGACRLCVVEVDGLRGFPTSCTTPVEDGMIIRTDTAEVKSLRKEVLKLLLSEHPASCLFCNEHVECKQFQGTIRKVGVTTGCRYCPNDNRCELQRITESVGLTDTSYPVYYRNVLVEKNDPFYDRDYNLCILCGRCIRVCNNIRLNGTLSFKQRGRLTTVGPAFARTHREAGCEFCGACVTACPTGALSVKVSKWYGPPEDEVGTTCHYCSLGCRLMLQVSHNEVIDALPDYDSSVDHGLICVKGRFGLPEYVHSPLRYGTPKELTPVGYNDISWDRAIALAAEKLTGVAREDFLLVASSQLTNEDYFVAQQFIRQVMGSDMIISSPVIQLDEDLGSFLDLALASDEMDSIDKAQAILAVGFDSRYGYSPLGVNIKKAVQAGAGLVALSASGTNLDLISECSFHAGNAGWADLLDAFTARTSRGKPASSLAAMNRKWSTDVENAWKLFSSSSSNVAVVGEEVLSLPGRSAIFHSLIRMRDKFGWSVVVAHQHTNLKGMLAMGLFPGLNPGEILRPANGGHAVTVKTDLGQISLDRRKKVIYCIGEAPVNILPETDFFIYQNGLPPQSSLHPDLILPACLFPESEGTIVNGSGRVLPVKKAIEPYMESKPDWWILKGIAEKIKKGALKFKDTSSIQNDIKKLIKGFPNLKEGLSFKKISVKGSITTSDRNSRSLSAGVRSSYRGILLADVVGGMATIEKRAE